MQNCYYIDHHFLEAYQQVDRFNWFEYFQGHPDFDPNCLNFKYLKQDITLKDLLTKKQQGIYFHFELQNGIGQIKKLLIEGEKYFLIKVFYMYDNKIFNSGNLKQILLNKTGNLASIINSLVGNHINTN